MDKSFDLKELEARLDGFSAATIKMVDRTIALRSEVRAIRNHRGEAEFMIRACPSPEAAMQMLALVFMTDMIIDLRAELAERKVQAN